MLTFWVFHSVLSIVSLSRLLWHWLLALLMLLLLLEVHLRLFISLRTKLIMMCMMVGTASYGLARAGRSLVVIVWSTTRSIRCSICWTRSLLTGSHAICTALGGLQVGLAIIIVLTTFWNVLSVHVVTGMLWRVMVVRAAQSIVRRHWLRVVVLMIVASVRVMTSIVSLNCSLWCIIHDTGYVLLRATCITNNLNGTISEGRQDTLRIYGTLHLFLLLLLLTDSFPVSTHFLGCVRTFRSIDSLLWTAISYDQRIVVSKQLVIVDATICHSCVSSMMTARQILVLVTSYHCWGSVYHMVLMRWVHMWATSPVLLWCLVIAMSLVWPTVARILLPLHRAFWISERSTIVVWVPLRGVLMLSLRIVLMVVGTSTAASCHWLVNSIIRALGCRSISSLHVFGSRARSVRPTRNNTRIHVMSTMHFLLTSWTTVMSRARVSNSWSGSLSVTPRRLSVTWTMNCLILM